jgi:hypothetical protein
VNQLADALRNPHHGLARNSRMSTRNPVREKRGDEAVAGKRSVQLARLGIALISVLSASSALAAARAEPHGQCGAELLADEALNRPAAPKIRRPPRVPKREAYLHGEWRVGQTVGGGP